MWPQVASSWPQVASSWPQVGSRQLQGQFWRQVEAARTSKNKGQPFVFKGILRSRQPQLASKIGLEAVLSQLEANLSQLDLNLSQLEAKLEPS